MGSCNNSVKLKIITKQQLPGYLQSSFTLGDALVLTAEHKGDRHAG
jgi:hypothetical protein